MLKEGDINFWVRMFFVMQGVQKLPLLWAKAGMAGGFLRDWFKASGLLSGYDIPYEARKHKHSADQVYTNKGIKALVSLNYAIRISKGKDTFTPF